MIKIQKNEKGFTLVEIMIVVAIIGLLAAIAIPNLLRARVNANEGAMKTAMRTFSSSAESYRAAQAVPAYPEDMDALTTATPPYLDDTWGATKHGFDLAYAVADDFSTYDFLATPTAGGGATSSYCVDHTGVVVGGADDDAPATTDGAGCDGGNNIGG
jgi:type IV pilus assembly protein PilA